MTIVGLDIGGTTCEAILGDDAGGVVDAVRIETGPPEPTLDRLIAAVESFDLDDPPRIGISCGGPLDAAGGKVLSPPNLPAWDDVPIVDLVQQRLGGQAWLMNDANAGALAEWHFGGGRGARTMAFLTHGTGMGAGLIIDGRLHEGATGDAGEVGHVRLSDDGPVGYGKAGSFEGWCSGGGIARLAQQWADRGRLPPAAPDGRPWTARALTEAARRGDGSAAALLNESGRRLGQGLSLLIDILNPDVIVLGSLFVRARRFLEPAMPETLRRETLGRPLGACTVRAAELGEAIGRVAALSVALYRSGEMPA